MGRLFVISGVFSVSQGCCMVQACFRMLKREEIPAVCYSSSQNEKQQSPMGTSPYITFHKPKLCPISNDVQQGFQLRLEHGKCSLQVGEVLSFEGLGPFET